MNESCGQEELYGQTKLYVAACRRMDLYKRHNLGQEVVPLKDR